MLGCSVCIAQGFTFVQSPSQHVPCLTSTLKFPIGRSTTGRSNKAANYRLRLHMISFPRPILSENDLTEPPDNRVIQAVEDLRGTKIIATGMFVSLYMWNFYLCYRTLYEFS